MKKLLSALVVITIVITGVAWALSEPAQPTSAEQPASRSVETYSPATREGVFALVNKEREKIGVAPLQMDERLNQSARWMADYMAKNDFYDHTDPKTGEDVGLDKIIELTGRTCGFLSENQNRGSDMYSTNKAMVDSWMGSKSHREALLDNKYILTGLGVATAKDGSTMVVQHFCATQNYCDNVTSYDYDLNNDVLCTRKDGSRFYTSYGGANAFLAQ